MSNWKEDLQKALEAGKKPTYEQLEAAVLGAMQEHKAMDKALKNMVHSLTDIFTAYLTGDAAKLAKVIATYMNVKAQLTEDVQPRQPGAADVTH